MNLTIREFNQNDFTFLKEIISEYLEKEISDADLQNRMDFIKNCTTENLYVCEIDSVGRGIIATRIRENIEENSRFLEVSLIVTRLSERRNGLGKQMISFAEQKAKELKCTGLWLVSGFGREEAAHKFYKDLGFVITGYRFRKIF